MRLEQFQAVPVLDFGCSMAVGEAKALDLEVINPRGEPQELTVDRLAVCKGIIWEGPPLPLRVPPHKSVVVRLAWRPRRPGPFSESVLFKWGDRHRLQVRARSLKPWLTRHDLQRGCNTAALSQGGFVCR